MKKNMMRKNLRQSIKKSLGRYIAIVAIIALGAGLFCGLRVTKKDMVATMQKYTDDQNMFDIRVMNTYGWTDEDVAALSQTAGIADAEGSISLDALLHLEDGEDGAWKLMSIPENVNLVSLDAGRLPQSDDEILADSLMFDESILGQCVYVSEANEESTLENLAYDTYTIVGLCSTPMYMNMQRGSTTIGSGALTSYFYLPIGGFAMDVYTEISLTLVGEYQIYSDEFNDAMDSMADVLEPIAQPLADQRYVVVKKQAEEEYAEGMDEYLDGMKEYLQGKQEADEKLAEAEQEILNAEAEVESNRKLLEEGQVQLEEAENTLDESLSAIAQSRTELAAARSEAYEQMAAVYDELFANYKEVTAGQNQVELGLSQLESGIAQIESGISQIDTGLSTISIMLPILETSIATAQNTLDAIQQLPSAQDYQEQLTQAQENLNELTAQRDSYVAQQTELETTKPQLESQLKELNTQKIQLETTKATLEAALDTIEIGFKEAEVAQSQAENQFTAAELQLDAAEAQIELGRQELETQRVELEEGLLTLEDAEAQVAEGRAEFEKEKAEVLAELADAEAELADGRQQLDDARKTIDEMGPADVYVLTRNTNIGYVVMENDSQIVEGVSEIFPVFFLSVAALVCITTMTRMVDEERTQIGVLKALGYSNFSIMWKYLAYSGSAAIVGCLLGVLVGNSLFPKVIWQAYCIMYNFSDDLVLTLEYPVIGIVAAVYIGLMLLVTWYCCKRSLKEVPAELIRPKAPAAGKKIFLEKLPIWKKLKFLDKVALRNIFRYRQRMVMMLLGIGGCTALLITGFGLSDSINGLADYQFSSVAVYDMSVSFSDPLTEDQQSDFKEKFRGQTQGILFCEQGGVDLEFSNSVKSVNYIAVEKSLDGFIDLHDEDGAISMPGQNEALVSFGAANSMGIEVGDTILVRNSDMEQLKLTVSGIFDNNVYNYVIVTGDTLRSQWNRSPEMTSAFVVNGSAQEIHELSADMTKFDGVLSTSINQDTADTVNGMMEALDAVVALVVACASLLAIIVLYNLTNINIKERVREIATIKVLGFNARETAAYVFKENLALTLVGTALGLVGGKFLHAAVMGCIRIDMVWITNYIAPGSYVISVVLTLLAALAVDFLMYFQLEKINMAEALKSVE